MDSKIPKFSPLEKIDAGGKVFFKFLVEGIFSHPLLRPQDIITIERIDAGRISRGDFVFGDNSSFQRGVFQVIGKRTENEETVLMLRGEYGLYFDDKLYARDLVGKLVLVKRGRHSMKVDTFPRSIKNKFGIRLMLLKRRIIGIAKLFLRPAFLAYFSKIFLLKAKLVYRNAEVSDLSAIARLFRWHYWPMPLESIRRKMRNIIFEAGGKQYCFIACRKDAVVGIIVTKEEYDADRGRFFWYGGMLYLDFFYRHLGIAPEFSLFVLRQGLKNNIAEFRAVSVKSMRPYAEILFKKLNLDKAGSVIIEEESGQLSGRPGRKRLNYTIKITRSDILLDRPLPK
ncbi:MAG: hypothetical protein PHQ84_05995 [Candidatus Omnitrophica bacterium]|jgi:hypothetical protein|nr:hypothetical protein [Candidatus Omnitrophota bacterium]